MDGEKPPLLFTFLVTSGLYSVIDSEQYVNQLGFSGRPIPRIYRNFLVCIQAVEVIQFLAQNRVILQYCY